MATTGESQKVVKPGDINIYSVRTAVEDLKEALGVPQIRLYPTLDSLARRDLVDRTGERFTVPG